jgi:arylformamidase
MNKDKIVDLSHKIIEGKEHFLLEVQVDDVTKIIPRVKHHPDDWYVVGIVKYCTHVGTHIEAPFHHKKGGMDIAEFPFRKLIAPLVVMDFTNKKGIEAITLNEVKAYDKRIKLGDVVFIWTGMDKLFHTDRWEERKPYLTEEAARWLVKKKVSCVGTDTSDIEIPGLLTQPVHQTLFAADIPMVESLANLELVAKGDYIVFILPTPFVGLDSSPCRLIAIPKEEMNWD